MRRVVAVVVGVLALPVWALNQLLRWDPLARHSAPDGWSDAPRPSGRASRRGYDRPTVRDSWRSRAHAAVLVVAPLPLVAWVALSMRPTGLPGDDPDGAPRDNTIAHDEPWADAYFEELFGTPFEYDPALLIREPDRSGQYVNVTDRVRRSYEPAGLGPDSPVVWFFGSSSLFGNGQRDEHTIPSQVARLAEGDGVTLRVENFGVPNYESWADGLLLAQMLAERPDPDLIVMYEGYNDFARYLPPGSATTYDPFFGQQNREALLDQGAAIARDDGVDRTDDWSPENAAELFDRGVALARDQARAHDIPIVQFLQPCVWTRDLDVDDATLDNIGADREYHDAIAEYWDDTRALVDDDVIDLSDVLDDVDELVYWDQVHTNEDAARAVAAAIWDRLPELPVRG